MSQFVACAAVYFFNLRGDILLERVFRADVDRTIAELFRTQILNNRDAAALQAPVRTLGSCTYMFLRHADIYILCLSRNNCNVMLAFQFMTSLATLFKSYFQGELNEANIRNNFVLMYELLDEAMDHGYPQLTDPTVLKSLITQKGWLSELGELGDLLGKKKKEEPASNATLQVTGAVSWRREGIKHKKNMLFLDLVEQVNVLVGSNGTVLRSDVVGKILIKSLLSDMPELRLGLNDAAEDATFHQCVNLGTFESQKVITFVPPDGEFELMR
ncbi:Mu homology domain-containing protein [Haematococcus lacustris]